MGNLSEPSIREIAISLCSNEDKEIALNAMELFINNYQEGDSKYIDPLLNTVWDKDILHGACMDAIELFKKHPLKELVNTMLWVYENTPCTHCRNRAVNLLTEKGWLPETQLKECLYDCVKDTRELANNINYVAINN